MKTAPQGICTLANDVVYDQWVALLNSIEAISGSEIPICVFPFDDRLDLISAEVARRPNVFIYDDQESIHQWDLFMQQAKPNQAKTRLYGGHRRFAAFDGPFEKFIYMDADTLLMKPLDEVFEKLDKYDRVAYDFQFYSPARIYNLNSPLLPKIFDKERIRAEVFCDGFFGSKKGLFNPEKREWLLSNLKAGEVEILSDHGHDQKVLNYMFMRSGYSIYNFSHHLPKAERAGNSVTSTHFEERDHILYDKGNRLTYIHYIGLLPDIMARVCAGENLVFPYRDLFLYYRFLHEPEKHPIFKDPPKEILAKQPRPTLMKKILRKIGLAR